MVVSATFQAHWCNFKNLIKKSNWKIQLSSQSLYFKLILRELKFWDFKIFLRFWDFEMFRFKIDFQISNYFYWIVSVCDASSESNLKCDGWLIIFKRFSNQWTKFTFFLYWERNCFRMKTNFGHFSNIF